MEKINLVTETHILPYLGVGLSYATMQVYKNVSISSIDCFTSNFECDDKMRSTLAFKTENVSFIIKGNLKFKGIVFLGNDINLDLNESRNSECRKVNVGFCCEYYMLPTAMPLVKCDFTNLKIDRDTLVKFNSLFYLPN